MKKEKDKVKKHKEYVSMVKKSIPDGIKIMYGKFIAFSIIYLLFFSIIYPFFLINKISKIGSAIIFITLILFYGYMIIDVWKKKKTYISEGFILIIPMVFLAISFSLIKFIF